MATEMCVLVFGNGMNLRLAKGLIYTRPCDHDGTLLNVPAAPLWLEWDDCKRVDIFKISISNRKFRDILDSNWL